MTPHPGKVHLAGDDRHTSASGQHEKMCCPAARPIRDGMTSALHRGEKFSRHDTCIASWRCNFFIGSDRHTRGNLRPILFTRTPQRLSFVKKRGDASPFPKKTLLFPDEKKPFSPNRRIWGECPHSCRRIARRGKSMLCSPARPEGTGLHAQQAGYTPGRKSRCAGRPCRQGLHC